MSNPFEKLVKAKMLPGVLVVLWTSLVAFAAWCQYLIQ